MSEGDGHHGKNEIIIIKRHGGHHEGHHGGAWKIAYADFMTAMMAFFLVMWLINAANEETKAAIASYFNPVQLTDQKPSERGLKKPAKDAKGESTQEKSKTDGTESKTGGSAKSGEEKTATSGEETKYSDADFFENPYSVLSEIANEVGQQANISSKGEGGASLSGPATGADGGEAYRDPFDPDFWTKQVEVRSSNTGTADQSVAQAAAVETGKDAAGKKDADKKDAAGKDVADKDKDGQKNKDGKADGTGKAGGADGKNPVGQTAGKETELADGTAKPTPTAQEEAQKQADALKAQIEKEIGPAAGKLAEGLIVTPTEGGLLVTISEQRDTPMFGLGSAVPEGQLVVAMEKIGKLLSARSGAVAIRGHTDGRPFKDGNYDNWRLSAARAQSAYYMLVRGGLNENRVSQITGFADRRLQVPKDPLAPANRRIEILLQTGKV